MRRVLIIALATFAGFTVTRCATSDWPVTADAQMAVADVRSTIDAVSKAERDLAKAKADRAAATDLHRRMADLGDRMDAAVRAMAAAETEEQRTAAAAEQARIRREHAKVQAEIDARRTP